MSDRESPRKRQEVTLDAQMISRKYDKSLICMNVNIVRHNTIAIRL